MYVCKIYFDSYWSTPLIYNAKLYFIDENGDIEYNGNNYSTIKDAVISNNILKSRYENYLKFIGDDNNGS